MPCEPTVRIGPVRAQARTVSDARRIMGIKETFGGDACHARVNGFDQHAGLVGTGRVFFADRARMSRSSATGGRSKSRTLTRGLATCS